MLSPLLTTNLVNIRGGHKALAAAMLSWTACMTLLVAMTIPIGNEWQLGPNTISTSAIRLDSGILFILAIVSVSMCGASLLALLLHEEPTTLKPASLIVEMTTQALPFGLTLVPVVLLYGSLDLNEICIAQSGLWLGFIPKWGVFNPLGMVSALIFCSSLLSESNQTLLGPYIEPTKRDALNEVGHSWLIDRACFCLESFKLFTFASLGVTLYGGGWQIPFVPYETLVSVTASPQLASLIGAGVMLLKSVCVCVLYTRFRKHLAGTTGDQIVTLGRRYNTPIAIANVMVTAGTLTFLGV